MHFGARALTMASRAEVSVWEAHWLPWKNSKWSDSILPLLLLPGCRCDKFIPSVWKVDFYSSAEPCLQKIFKSIACSCRAALLHSHTALSHPASSLQQALTRKLSPSSGDIMSHYGNSDSTPVRSWTYLSDYLSLTTKSPPFPCALDNNSRCTQIFHS